MIETNLIERGHIDKVAELAALTGENVLITGEPGTAKSMQAERFFEHFPHAKSFQAQLSKFSQEETLFGPLDVPSLREGEYRFNYKNTILDAHFAYIDELFDASDVLLRTLLSVLNEHKFQRGNFKVQCPLISAFGTANYSRINQVTEAVVDRFIFQVHVSPLSHTGKEFLLDGFEQDFSPEETLTLKQLRMHQKEIYDVSMSHKIRDALIHVGNKLGFTDRRLLKAAHVLRAVAYMEGHEQVSWEHFPDLIHMHSIDSQSAAEARTVIDDIINEMSVKHEQINKINALEREWEDIGGEHSNPEHIKAEGKILKQFAWISPVNDEVEAKIQRILNERKDHYQRNKNYFLESLGFDEDV